MQAHLGRNPLLDPTCHVPDCEARSMPDGRLYLYGSWDVSRDYYCSAQYRVFSTADMIHWQDHGVSFTSGQVPWAAAGEKEMLYAPDCVEKDGKYYLYFCMTDGTEGVAEADRPEGPFSQPVQLEARGIDPSVFVDEDGQAYYYWGQFSAHGAKLRADMLSIAEESIVDGIVTEEAHHFHEGSSVRKRNGIYYYVFADISSGKPTALGYATSRSPLGPYTYQGIIIDNVDCDPKSWNNHGSIEEFHGQWYVFYHRSSQGSNAMRRVCAEPIFFREDGTIIPVEMTSTGAGKDFEPGEKMRAFHACRLRGQLRLLPVHGEEWASEIAEGDTLLLKYFRLEEAAALTPELETEGEGGAEIFLDDQLLIPGKTVFPPGRYAVRLRFHPQGKMCFHALTLKPAQHGRP